MIKPPATSTCYYSALFDAQAAEFIAGLVTNSFGTSGDITTAVVTSEDFGSDVEAANELDDGLQEVFSNITDFDEVVDCDTRFNPIFLPSTSNILDVVSVSDSTGDVSIEHFESPFIVLKTTFSTERFSDVITGCVKFNEFDLPSLHTSSDLNKEVLVS